MCTSARLHLQYFKLAWVLSFNIARSTFLTLPLYLLFFQSHFPFSPLHLLSFFCLLYSLFFISIPLQSQYYCLLWKTVYVDKPRVLALAPSQLSGRVLPGVLPVL